MKLQLVPVTGIPEIRAGDDLAKLIVEHLDQPLGAGDIVIVTSKIVSKAAGLVTRGDRDALITQQSDRVVARRGATAVVRTRHGLTMAAAGVDASNTPEGTVVPLPTDPDADAGDLRAAIRAHTGHDVAVVITDTAGRAWRLGQTDIAIGVAGLAPRLSYAGAVDHHGNMLAVTSPAIADEIASAGDLVKGKLDNCPVAVLRGAPGDWLLEEDGPGATTLIRPESDDMFGLGALDAVRAAVRRDREPVRGFPDAQPGAIEQIVADAASRTDLDHVTARLTAPGIVEVSTRTPLARRTWVDVGAVAERLRTLAAAHQVSLHVHVTGLD